MSELSVYELEAQHGELLPEREALGSFISFNSNVVNSANNFNFAVLAFNNVQV